MTERLIVIGNGMAGLRLVEELQARAPAAYRTVVLGAETVPAYNRVLLSALLAGDAAPEDIALQPREWYGAQGVELRLGTRVREIVPGARQVVTEAGEALTYDKLVLATGSDPLRLPLPGMNLEGVLTFRDLDDVEKMSGALPETERAVVVGGGLLGLEAAYGLARRGLSVTVVHLMDRLMERQLDPAAADLLRRSLAGKGIDVRLAARSEAVVGDDRVEGLRLADGEMLPAGLVVFAVGIRPQKDLAEAAGLTCDRGIRVDDGLETSQPGIYALGECAEHAGICYGLVSPAYEQAAVLARRLAGESARYAGSLLATSLKVSGVDVFSAGDFLGEWANDEVVLSDAGAGTYRKLVFVGDRLTGAVLFGDTSDSHFFLDLMRSAEPIAWPKTDLIFGPALVEAA